MDLERNSLGLGKRPALVVVDMIKGFTDAACPLGCDCPEVVEANRDFLVLQENRLSDQKTTLRRVNPARLQRLLADYRDK